jgi:NADPH-dependent 2,4-dienoyl-CoA reductase/sulfur reductase-like enzyme
MRTFDCEILVLGAGPAGPAALAAARCGKSVIVLDDNPRPGGQIWRDGPQVSLPPRALRLRQAVAEQPGITLLNGARLIARPAPHSVVFETADTCGRSAGSD